MTDDLARKVARAELWRRILIVTCILAVVTALGVGIGGIIAIRHTQSTGTPTGKKILEIADDIKSCTTPAGECYRRGQSQTRFAIDSVNEITIYAVTCGQQLPEASVDAVQRCVAELYTKNHPKS